MAIVLFRVDERLIHGQVVVGWGTALHPDMVVVVDDDLADSGWEQELYTLGLPPSLKARFTTVAEARDELPAWQASAERLLLLTRDVRTMRRLLDGGVLPGAQVNIGGLHFAPGRRPVLPYVFLSEEERQEMERLAAGGVTVTARDLPTTRAVDAAQLLGSG